MLQRMEASMTTPKVRAGDREPTTFFQLERARRGLDEPVELEPVPALPSTSPWSAENVLPDELPIDRRCDGGNGPIEGDEQ
jgi:hypothetical protein